MKFTVLSLFPEILEGFFQSSLMKKAVDKGLIVVEFVNIRDFAMDRHKTCDDIPYGGGAGRTADDSNTTISTGGSAGGASGSAGGAAGTATQTSQSPFTGYGTAGGTKNDSAAGNYAGGGGGGAGGAATGRTAGVGLANSITGTSVTYAAGGYGQGTSTFVNAGVSGGANTGDGGNGATNGATGATNGAGAGGSGVVIISVPTANYSGTTTGSPTVTTSGSNTIIKFTASGSYTA